jgi:hypothetical protein
MRNRIRLAALLAAAATLWTSACASSRVQGQIGFIDLDTDAIELDDPADVVTDGGGANMPTIGAAVQMAGIGQRAVTAGVEWGGTLSWENDRGAVAAGNGTVVVVSDNDYLLADVFAGLYVNVDLGERWRIYGGAGPLLQYGRIDLEYIDESNNLIDVGGDGFGLGTYVRAGIERTIGATTVGIGARWMRSSIDPGSGIDELDLEGVQYLITATQSL